MRKVKLYKLEIKSKLQILKTIANEFDFLFLVLFCILFTLSPYIYIFIKGN